MMVQLGTIRESVTLVAGSGVFLADSWFQSCDAFHAAEDIPDGCGFTAADVVHFPDMTADRRHCRRHAIEHKSVAAYLFPITVHGDGFPVAKGLHKFRISHIWP